MQALLDLHGPAPFYPNPVKVEPPYRTLVSSIVGQQLSGKAAETIWKRLEARFPIQPEALHAADPQELRALGLSGAKAAYVRVLSRFALEGGLEGLEPLSDEEIIARLLSVKGIGVWSAQMYLMFGLGRPDVWPILDLGVRKGAERLYGPLDKRGLERLGERFRPHRSHAAWYLWRVLEHK
jgi:DNA-3-methyladenine glycosylase II